MHFLFMCHESYCHLKPKFKWKHEFPIGELELIPTQAEEPGPLGNIMEKTLDQESNNNNIVKEEVPTDTETNPTAQVIQQDLLGELGLVQVPALPSTDAELQDATQNLLVSLPEDTDPVFMDAIMAIEQEATTTEILTHQEMPVTIPCSINLTDIAVNLVDGVLVIPSSQVPLEPKVIINNDKYDLKERAAHDRISVRSKRKASTNLNYGRMDVTSE